MAALLIDALVTVMLAQYANEVGAADIARQFHAQANT